VEISEGVGEKMSRPERGNVRKMFAQYKSIRSDVANFRRLLIDEYLEIHLNIKEKGQWLFNTDIKA